MSALQMNGGRGLVFSDNTRQWMKAALIAVALFALLAMLSNMAYASDGDEFADASAKFETWIKGNLGKLAGFVALGVGAVVAAVKKDWSWFFGAIILSMGIGIIAGVINASFTATI